MKKACKLCTHFISAKYCSLYNNQMNDVLKKRCTTFFIERKKNISHYFGSIYATMIVSSFQFEFAHYIQIFTYAIVYTTYFSFLQYYFDAIQIHLIKTLLKMRTKPNIVFYLFKCYKCEVSCWFHSCTLLFFKVL